MQSLRNPSHCRQAGRLCKHLPLFACAKVIIAEGNPGADNAKQRKAGFMKTVEKYSLDLLSSTTAHREQESP